MAILSAHQPAYLAWSGWFDKVRRSDTFVILDGLQFGKHDFINRNRILKDGKPQWLTVAVDSHGKRDINKTPIVDRVGWQQRHWDTIRQAYLGAEFASGSMALLDEVLLWNGPDNPFDTAADLGMTSVNIYRMLFPGDTGKIVWQSEQRWMARENFRGPNEMLITICKEYACDTFLFGMNGREYVDMDMWNWAKVGVVFQEYNCPECLSLDGTPLSIVHLLCNYGLDGTRRILCESR